MKEIFYLILDLAVYLTYGYLLYDLLRAENKRLKGMIAVYIATELIKSYIPFIKKIYYGENLAPTASRQTILPAVTVLFIVCAYCVIFLKENRAKNLYLIFTFFTYKSLIRYSLYTFWQYLLELYSSWFLKKAETGKIGIEAFMKYMELGEVLWNIFYSLFIVLLFAYLVKRVKKYTNQIGLISRRELIYLYVPIIMAVFYDVLLRSILFSMNGEQAIFLLTDNPETRLLVPAMSVLSMLMIYFSLYTFVRLRKEQEEKSMLLIYENRLSEMGQHVREVEQLYEGIRGMKHDLKNYVADMEAMLEQKKEDSLYQIEMKQYLQGMCESLDELDITYHTGNPVTDVVISRYLKRAADLKITVECSFGIPAALNIDTFDISILLHNGLENALEAIQNEKENNEKAFLSIRSWQKENMFVLEIKNSFYGIIRRFDEERLPVTSKDGGHHGYGIKNMKRCAQKYKGDIDFCLENNEAILTVMLQGKL